MAEHTYELKSPIQYARKGEMVDGSFVTMTAPTFREVDKVAPIKQAFMAALSDVSDGTEATPEEKEAAEGVEITGKEIMQLLYRAKASVADIMRHAEKLLRSGVFRLDGEEKFTSPLLDKMSLEDFEGLVGDYIANFIMPSLTDGA